MRSGEQTASEVPGDGMHCDPFARRNLRCDPRRLLQSLESKMLLGGLAVSCASHPTRLGPTLPRRDR